MKQHDHYLAYDDDLYVADQWNGGSIMMSIEDGEFTVIDYIMVVSFIFLID